MKSREALEKRVTELEYRLRIIEKILDRTSGVLHINHDESLMNSMRINVVDDMRKEGFEVSEVRGIWGTNLYREGKKE